MYRVTVSTIFTRFSIQPEIIWEFSETGLSGQNWIKWILIGGGGGVRLVEPVKMFYVWLYIYPPSYVCVCAFTLRH